MKTKTILIVLASTILLISGCTIEKRVFQKGYHIEWKKKIPKKDEAETSNRISEREQEIDPTSCVAFENNSIPETEESFPECLPEPVFRESIVESITPAKDPEIINYIEPENHKKTSLIRQKIKKQPWETEERKVFELFGVMSFGLYFCSLALGVISIFALNALPTIVIACFMVLLSFIFGIISVKRYRRNKSDYRRNFFGYFGLIASAVTIFWTAFLLLFAWGLDSF